ncbi:MAG: GNAT family N-acetyltransferase [Rhodobacteraceae bacterium]|nr:GNAT family N-acetyltransferase [Paracoccaceae bacterium]
MTAPTLQTERLTLRAPRLADFERWAEFFASDRSRHERGPLDRIEGYKTWAADVALWTLRGYGPFGLDDRATGDYLGEVGIYQPEGYPGPELGWFVVPEAEGKGYAAEAARAHAFRDLGWTTAVSYIDPANARSIALAERLGAIRDEKAAHPGDTPCLVYRHRAPEARA